jgi:hypothetical protein
MRGIGAPSLISSTSIRVRRKAEDSSRSVAKRHGPKTAPTTDPTTLPIDWPTGQGRSRYDSSPSLRGKGSSREPTSYRRPTRPHTDNGRDRDVHISTSGTFDRSLEPFRCQQRCFGFGLLDKRSAPRSLGPRDRQLSRRPEGRCTHRGRERKSLSDHVPEPTDHSSIPSLGDTDPFSSSYSRRVHSMGGRGAAFGGASNSGTLSEDRLQFSGRVSPPSAVAKPPPVAYPNSEPVTCPGDGRGLFRGPTEDHTYRPREQARSEQVFALRNDGQHREETPGERLEPHFAFTLAAVENDLRRDSSYPRLQRGFNGGHAPPGQPVAMGHAPRLLTGPLDQLQNTQGVQCNPFARAPRLLDSQRSDTLAILCGLWSQDVRMQAVHQPGSVRLSLLGQEP